MYSDKSMMQVGAHCLDLQSSTEHEYLSKMYHHVILIKYHNEQVNTTENAVLFPILISNLFIGSASNEVRRFHGLSF